MAELARYHISEQTAYALLQPVEADLRRLHARTSHYAGRLNLASEADRAALDAAARALETAAREIERLIAGDTPTTGRA